MKYHFLTDFRVFVSAGGSHLMTPQVESNFSHFVTYLRLCCFTQLNFRVVTFANPVWAHSHTSTGCFIQGDHLQTPAVCITSKIPLLIPQVWPFFLLLSLKFYWFNIYLHLPSSCDHCLHAVPLGYCTTIKCPSSSTSLHWQKYHGVSNYSPWGDSVVLCWFAMPVPPLRMTHFNWCNSQRVSESGEQIPSSFESLLQNGFSDSAFTSSHALQIQHMSMSLRNVIGWALTLSLVQICFFANSYSALCPWDAHLRMLCNFPQKRLMVFIPRVLQLLLEIYS